MSTTVSIMCYKSKTLKNGEHPLMLCVTKDRKRKYQSLGISVKLEHWDFSKNKPKSNCPNRDLINKIMLDKELSFQKQKMLINSTIYSTIYYVCYVKIILGMIIGNNIRKLRIVKRLSQQMIADKLNVDRRTYASWEQGSQDIKSRYIPLLAEFFEVEISELFSKESKININQSYKDDSIDTAIIILTDKEAIERVLDVIKRYTK